MKFKKMAVFMASIITITGIGTNLSFAYDNTTNEELAYNESIENEALSRDEVIEWYKLNGVDDETINSIMNKVDNNEMPDSVDPSQQSKGRILYSNDNETKIVYPDGSIAITGIEEGEKIEVEPKGITNGSTSSGSGYVSYRGSKVYHKTGILNMSFFANYTYVQGGYDKIDNVYDKKCTSYMGTWSYVSFGRQKIMEDLNGPARARFEVIYNSSIGESSSSGNYYLDLRVGKDRASSYFY